MSDTTLTDISKALGFNESNSRSTESYFGTVTAIDPEDDSSYVIERNGTYYYWVLIDGNDNPTECARLVNATAGDRVLVNVLQNGHSVVMSRIDGDLNANDAKRIADKTFIYDHTYSYVENSSTGKIDVVFTAHLYRGGVDVADQISGANFTWWEKTEETIDYEDVSDDGLIPLGTGRVITIPDISSKVGYGLHVIGRYEDITDVSLEDVEYNDLTDIENNVLQATIHAGTGNSIRVRDLEVITTIFPTDKFLVVTANGEKLITAATLSDAADKHYTHTQDVVSDIWTIQHNLNKKPSVTVIDSGNSVVEGDISYIDNNTLTISFNGAFSGKAYCN